MVLNAIKTVALALAASLALAAGATSDSSAGSMAMSVGTKGDTVQAENGTTVFMGTEYNPSKCKLQFVSLKCDDNCAELNGWPLVCNNKGKQDGKNKMMCECDKSVDTEGVCQSQTNPNVTGTVPQFGDCSDNKQCVDSYGYIATSTEEGPICAEKLHCVQEVNTTATEPASICHTCMSCIAQNSAAEDSLADVKRFNCTAICPKEILDTIAEKNAAGVGIADAVPVTETPTPTTSNSTGTTGTTDSSAAGSTAGSNAAVVPHVNALAAAAAVVVAALSLAWTN